MGKMGKKSGFLEFSRKDPGYRPIAERTRDYKAAELTLTEDQIREQAARCMYCGTAFCHGAGCPLKNVIPELNDLVYRNRLEEALELLLSTNNFPEFTGRICPALCEASCVLAINDNATAVRQIELFIIESAFERKLMRPRPPAVRSQKKVAVIGSGPAGLAAADVLNKAGYHVTIYDSDPKPGGILRYGIPDFKLEKNVIDRRIELMTAEGVAFEMNANMGDDISARYLLSRYDAICLAGGAREPRDLKIEGRELKGIHFAIDYLVQQNKRNAGEPVAGKDILASGKTVAVIGGGLLGNTIEKSQGKTTSYEVSLRMDDGSTRTIAAETLPAWRIGDNDLSRIPRSRMTRRQSKRSRPGNRWQ